MANEATYGVRLKYMVDDRGRAATRAMVNDTRRLKHEAAAARSEFARIGSVIVGAYGARAAGKALIGFNATVQDTKLQIQGMLALARRTDLADQARDAEKLYSSLQKRAASLPGTTQEYVQMASRITRVIADAGGSTKELEDMTVGAVVAAKSLGEQWEVAARDIEQGLMGRYNTTDPFLSKILPTIGYAGEEGRTKWRGLSKEKRFTEMQKALTQKQITQLAEQQGQSFSGVMSTLQDSMEQTLGKVGKPLFEAITVEIKRWNAWMVDNQGKVESIAKTLGEGLVKGFNVVKDTLGFLVSHADTLLTLGKIWAAIKIGSMLQGGVAMARSKGGEAMSGLAAWMAPARDRFNPQTGGYETIAAGAGRQRITAGSALENAGLLAQAGLTGYAIGQALGLDKLGHDMGRQIAIWTGRMDENYLAWEKLQEATRKVTDAMERAAAAADKNAKNEAEKARAVTNVQGMSYLYGQAANLLGDRARAMAARPMGRAGQFGGEAGPTIDAQSEQLIRQAAGKLGIAIDSLDRLSGPQLQAIMGSLRDTSSALKTRAETVTTLSQGNFDVALSTLTDYQKRTLDKQQAMLEVSQHINQSIAQGIPYNYGTILDIMRKNTQDPTGKHVDVAEKPKVNVTIQRIEVQSDDPDRFAFGLVEAFRDAAKNPSSAFATLREG